jgi:hypothetical protein
METDQIFENQRCVVRWFYALWRGNYAQRVAGEFCAAGKVSLVGNVLAKGAYVGAPPLRAHVGVEDGGEVRVD